MKKSTLAVLSAVIAMVGISTSFASNKVVYGKDDRLDIYDVTDARLVEAARSTVALFESSDVNEDSARGVSRLALSKYGSAMNLCTTERFFDQTIGAFCSGSLVGKDLIMTAGHCVTSDDSCAGTKFVFDYAITDKNGVSPSEILSSSVYSCKKLIARKQEGKGADFALVQIDREVTDRAPLEINRKNDLKKGTDIVVIGHPVGLPTKVSGGAKVRSLANGFFVANLDTYGGNSGSAVFNLNTGLVEGILVRGENDFVYQNGCRVSNVCTDTNCRGEDSTSMSALANLIPQL